MDLGLLLILASLLINFWWVLIPVIVILGFLLYKIAKFLIGLLFDIGKKGVEDYKKSQKSRRPSVSITKYDKTIRRTIK